MDVAVRQHLPDPALGTALSGDCLPQDEAQLRSLRAQLRDYCFDNQRSLVFVGMMGSGKTAIGRRLAERLEMDFIDVDAEIELGARMTIPEIFERYGEPYFRDGERRVIKRLLHEPPRVLATGGGAFMDAQTRAEIVERGFSIWLRPQSEVLMRRVRKKSNRPLLKTADPDATLRRLIAQRYPIYAKASLHIASQDGSHQQTLDKVEAALLRYLNLIPAASPPSLPDLGPPSGDILPVTSLEAFQAHSQAPSQPICVPVCVPVSVAGHTYDIHIGDGLLDEAGARIAALSQDGKARRAAIITDHHVADFYLPHLRKSLASAGIESVELVVEAGEQAKSAANFVKLCEDVIAARLERRDVVIALGGGVVGDLAGFVAASVRRGMGFVQIPTTLLAQVDSSVGGKTGINSTFGKNLIGAFYQPDLVLADTLCLDSLPAREFAAGYAEVVKYGLINDAPFFNWLEHNGAAIFAGESERRAAIAHCCQAKAAIVGRDERETGERALLNLGHTFAHAFERGVGYDAKRLIHGEAVAIGLVCAFELSHFLGYCDAALIARIEAHLHRFQLPTRIGMIKDYQPTLENLIEAMVQDKKTSSGELTFILAKGIGEAFIAKNIAKDTVRAFFADRGARLFSQSVPSESLF